MGKWLDIKGPVVADTVYADNTLVAKDVAFTLPGLEFMTADVMAMAVDNDRRKLSGRKPQLSLRKSHRSGSSRKRRQDPAPFPCPSPGRRRSGS